jgi:hypothetical protein
VNNAEWMKGKSNKEMIQVAIAFLEKYPTENIEHLLRDNPDVDEWKRAMVGWAMGAELLGSHIDLQAANMLNCVVDRIYVMGYNAGREAAESGF